MKLTDGWRKGAGEENVSIRFGALERTRDGLVSALVMMGTFYVIGLITLDRATSYLVERFVERWQSMMYGLRMATLGIATLVGGAVCEGWAVVKRGWRKLRIPTLILLATLAVGCAFEIPISMPGIRVTTNFPYNRYQLSVKNNIQGTLMKVEVNGVVVKRDIPAGENWVGGWFTLSPVRLSVVADFDDMGGRRIGSTYPKEFYFDGYYQNASTWVVSQWDLQR